MKVNSVFLNGTVYFFTYCDRVFQGEYIDLLLRSFISSYLQKQASYSNDLFKMPHPVYHA
jgi:hypothetical protein